MASFSVYATNRLTGARELMIAGLDRGLAEDHAGRVRAAMPIYNSPRDEAGEYGFAVTVEEEVPTVTKTTRWTPNEQARADRYQRESAALYRALKAALRREPTPRERLRAQEAFRAQMAGAA